MEPLNFPTYKFRIRTADNRKQIFDSIRKKFVALTPEEWVRQHMIRFLTDDLSYPGALISVESGLKYNRLAKRSDMMVFDRFGKPWMIIECKAPEVKITQETLRQAAIYNASVSLSCPYLAATNGLNHYCCEWVPSTSDWQFRKDFPPFPAP